MDSHIICGDCLEVMRQMPDNCVDSIVTDPPAGISFMGKAWDHDKGGRDKWVAWLAAIFKEGLRILKPGGHAFVWSLPRTSHWTAFALENAGPQGAGFEIRDCVYHVFGSGFPKSLDISKAIDKQAGAERKVVGRRYAADGTPVGGRNNSVCGEGWQRPWRDRPLEEQGQAWDTAPSTLDAQRWSGWHTALKPAVECWWLARKPLSEKTVAENVLRWGTGGLNIDACRIGTGDNLNGGGYSGGTPKSMFRGLDRLQPDEYRQPPGRFPANLIHDGSAEVLAGFPNTTSGGGPAIGAPRTRKNTYAEMPGISTSLPYGCNTGSAARFFYCAKASRAEREAGLEEVRTLFEQIEAMPKKSAPQEYGLGDSEGQRAPHQNAACRNNHPTVKPVALMRYLIRLITPPNGIVLDMFAGSGSTLVAAKELGVQWIGIEMDERYCEIATRRTATSALSSAVVKTHTENKCF